MTGYRDVLGAAALLGPVRRVGPAAWSATCPNCRRDHALRIRRDVGGERAACDACDVVAVRAALDRLDPSNSSDHGAR